MRARPQRAQGAIEASAWRTREVGRVVEVVLRKGASGGTAGEEGGTEWNAALRCAVLCSAVQSSSSRPAALVAPSLPRLRRALAGSPVASDFNVTCLPAETRQFLGLTPPPSAASTTSLSLARPPPPSSTHHHQTHQTQQPSYESQC